MSRLKNSGFTLVELMVAMTVGLFISAGVISLFIGTKQSYRANEGMARSQENGRFAIDHLSRDLRQAGYPKFVGAIFNWPPSDYIQGWEGASTAPAAANLPDYTPNTDLFRINYYDAELDTVVRHIYYIRPGASGAPALWQQRIVSGTTTNEELLEGIDNMQLSYGLDTNDNGQLDSYVDASTAIWNQVVAVRIDLLLGSSENNVVDAPMSLPFNGATFTAATDDRRLYQVFSTTITLRNRIK
ncbi:hypothetical protein CCR95_07940 [Thiocystis minor]|uniref:PilW family protein n=1 Tax=Thiocystis minor TaxID=61597 RepID=UPI001914C50D|nr:PilW family protein [Thiocystis minor]MBK5964019.1 hypothetical protein [Thiocystis minor]